jgi:uncharacterized protein YqeY
MSIQERINADLKQAMLAKDETRKSILRVLIGELTRIPDLPADKTVPDDKALGKIKKMVEDAKFTLTRTDLLEAHKVHSELAILESYLPKQLTRDELHCLISQLIEDKGYTSIKDMGKIMADLKAERNGQYDGKLASDLVKEIYK